jgi:hypothetical protein
VLLVLALAITVVIEVPIVCAFYPGQRVRMGIACALATSATNLFMNLVLLAAMGTYAGYLAMGEATALASEALVYVLVSRPRDVPRALAASGAANLASFLAGVVFLS